MVIRCRVNTIDARLDTAYYTNTLAGGDEIAVSVIFKRGFARRVHKNPGIVNNRSSVTANDKRVMRVTC